MAHEQLAHALADAAGDAEGLHLRRQRALALVAGQPLQGGDHLLAASQACAAVVGAKLAPAREPHRDHGGEQAEHHVQHHHDQEVERTGAVALAVARQGAVDDPAHHPCQHQHEGVEHALQQGHGHHVAVGHVRDLVAKHRLGLVGLHLPQQAGGHRHQGVVAVGTGGEGVDLRGVIDRHLGHADAGGLGLALHRGQQPTLGVVARLGDHVGAGGALGRALGHQQRDDRAAKAEQRADHQQAAELVGAYAQHRHDDARQHQYREVGGQEQGDAAEHGGLSPAAGKVSFPVGRKRR